MTIVRISHDKNNPYVMLNKNALEDPNLSWAAKGLWAYLMSRPDNWNVSVAHLSTIYNGKGGGEHAIYTLLNELIEQGYCVRNKLKAMDGRFYKTEYVIAELKNILPHRSLPDVAEPDPAEHPPNNKGVLINKEKQQQGGVVFSEMPNDSAAGLAALAEVEIPQYDKEQIATQFDASTIANAIEYASRVKIKTTRTATIIWACKNKPTPPEKPEERTARNKRIAMEYRNKIPSHRTGYEVLNNHIEIYVGGENAGFGLDYYADGFEDTLIEKLKHYMYI